MKKAIASAPVNFKNWIQSSSTYWTNPTHFWYNTGTVEPNYLNNILKKLLTNFAENDVKFVKDNLKPTETPYLLDKIDEKAVIKYREKEFRGEAFKSAKEVKSFVQDFKEAVFSKLGIKTDKEEPPDTIKELSNIKYVNRELAAHLIMQKIQSNAPLGPNEKKIGMELGILNTDGQPFVRGSGARNSQIIGRAGPMTDVTSGPPFDRSIKSDQWKDYYTRDSHEDVEYQTHLDEFEFENGCRDNDNYAFPAFDVDQNGKIVARCGRANWMHDAPLLTQTQFDNLDGDNKQLILSIRNLAKHWCPTPAHEIKLWRWIGVSYIGKKALSVLADEALRQLSDAVPNSVDPMTTLKLASREEQMAMIQQIRDKATQKKNGQKSEEENKEICKKRVLFLTQMISSNILFPYIPSEKDAKNLAGYNRGRVVIMLGWSKSGSIVCMQQGRTLVQRTYQAENIVDFSKYTSTVMRLRIFSDFTGGLAAGNYDFYVRVLRNANKNSCVKSLSDMKRFAVRAVLPKADQYKLDMIYSQAIQAGAPTEAQRQQIRNLQNIAILLQAKNLTTQELFIFEEILKMESNPDKSVVETAAKLYKSSDVDHRVTEAEEFENLALCQRPEFAPYLRKKLREKYPDMPIAEIEAMDRDSICRALINNPALDKIEVSVLLWQLKNVPTELIADNGLMDIFNGDERKQAQMGDWLMKNYGVTLKKMREYNQTAYGDEELSVYAKQSLDQARQEAAEKESELADILLFREFLLNGKSSNSEFCAKTYQTSNNESISVCSSDENGKSICVLDLFSVVYANICNPRVPLLMNDFEFILESSKALENYSKLMKRKTIGGIEKRLDKQCKQILTMYNAFMADCAEANWKDANLSNIQDQHAIKSIIQEYFPNNLLTAEPSLRNIWMAFYKTNPSGDAKQTFCMVVILYVASITGIINLNKS